MVSLVIAVVLLVLAFCFIAQTVILAGSLVRLFFLLTAWCFLALQLVLRIILLAGLAVYNRLQQRSKIEVPPDSHYRITRRLRLR
jgi:hypothetical protein